MAERRSKKLSVMIFLFAIFVLLVVFTASWVYRMYTEQVAFSEEGTAAAVECGKYYFYINTNTLTYEDGVLSFDFKNTLGADIESIVVQGVSEKKEVYLGGLGQGTEYPVSVPIEIDGWVKVYPLGCERANFRNLTVELES